ncbi:MAG: hypothetical protein M1823_006248 [Watsoniomyces obsoletus]|nr:MAG: hypothetical protein M1823_006248 [Watsoniomyces obsoletus]
MADRQPQVPDSMDQTDAHSARFSGRTLRADTLESSNSVSKVPLVALDAKTTTSIWTALSSWSPEIASYCISTVSLCAIVAVVQTRDGKPLPDWGDFITINFLVSVLTAILKAGLLMPVSEAVSELKWLWFAKPRPANDMEDFDRASRGPRGALRFLFQHPRNLWASLAALITVASLGIDALTQLTVQPYDCLWAVPGTASVGRTNNYTAAKVTGRFSIDVPMSRAIYKGVLSSDADRADIFYDCSTSNCTFEGATYYRTLAMCHSVINISANTKTHFEFQTLPSRLNTSDYTQIFATAESPPITNDAEEEPLFAFEALDLVGFAFRASLFPCLRTYKSLIISGNQLQHTLDSTTRLPRLNISKTPYFSLAGDFPPVPGIDCTPSTTSQGRKTCAVRTLKSGKRYVLPREEGSRRASDDEDLPFAQSPDISFYDPVCTYTFGHPPTKAIHRFLQIAYGTPESPKGIVSEGDFRADILLKFLSNDGLSNMTIAETYMARLADAMTVQMWRNGDSTNSAPILGRALRNRTCVRFEWKFLLLDVLLLVGTAGLVVVTVFLSWRDRQRMWRRAWKSSALPLLWCGLEDRTRRRFGGMDYAGKELWEKSKVVEVKLARAEDTEKERPSPRREMDGESEMGASEQEQEEDMGQAEGAGADLTDEMASSEKGRFLDSGGLVLCYQRDLPASNKDNIVRRVMETLSDALPI